MNILKYFLFVLALSFVFAGCESGFEGSSKLPDISNSDPQNPQTGNPGDGTDSGDPRGYTTQVMLFNGIGISTSDWQSTESILKKNGFSYKLVNSAALNAMTEDDLASYGALVFPGGYGNQITNGLTSQARINIRNAVINRGVGYVGFCAGAWTAVGPVPKAGTAASYGFAIVEGDILDLYTTLWGYEPTASMVMTTLPDGSKRDMIWVGGPITPEWKNGVLARYPTGEPAISQAFSGKGLVLVTGPHPEAPASWVPGYGLTDADGVDHDIAVDLINAAIKGEALPAF